MRDQAMRLDQLIDRNYDNSCPESNGYSLEWVSRQRGCMRPPNPYQSEWIGYLPKWMS